MIDFEFEPEIHSRLQMYHAVAEHMMRPISRDCDEHEHDQSRPSSLRDDVGRGGRRRNRCGSGPEERTPR